MKKYSLEVIPFGSQVQEWAEKQRDREQTKVALQQTEINELIDRIYADPNFREAMRRLADA